MSSLRTLSLLQLSPSFTVIAGPSASSFSCVVTSSSGSGSTSCCKTSSAVFPLSVGLRRIKSVSSSPASSSSASARPKSPSVKLLSSSPSSSSFSTSSSSPGGGASMPRGWLSKLGFRGTNNRAAQTDTVNSPALGADDDKPVAGQQFATFGAGCFWGVELALQRVTGVSKTEAGYSQGVIHDPTYSDVCEGTTGHSEVVRVQFDPQQCQYENLLDVFWKRHDPTTLNRQGGDIGTQYRSGIYYHTPEQEKAAKESFEAEQNKRNKKIVTEILPAKKFYRAEEYHQQYLGKGGRFGFRQSTEKGCNDPIRCYG